MDPHAVHVLNIPILLGTLREGRNSEKVAQYVMLEAQKRGINTEILDVKEMGLPLFDGKASPAVLTWSAKMKDADGLIVVAPEYNHGYPSALKNAIDYLYVEYGRKPMGICGVSMGPFGGARMIEQMKLVAVELHMVAIREAMYFPNVSTLFDAKGKIKSKDYEKFCNDFFGELVWYARALKAAREAAV
jgi:NAD(P)H-dependent FMN reductase